MEIQITEENTLATTAYRTKKRPRNREIATNDNAQQQMEHNNEDYKKKLIIHHFKFILIRIQI
jgi:hypothetical protein